MDAYKSTKAMDILKQTETGLYGLTAANGLGEAVTGKDMFGNELTEEQRQNSLMNALGIAGVAGAAKVADKMANGTKTARNLCKTKSRKPKAQSRIWARPSGKSKCQLELRLEK
ncbi:hypothetical protein ACQKL5_08790 [Peribacillus sp. NPDC097675]|uniref:hypothetical protein n=1 Tax=Peribacillus sp. NPDC097675 TaxID=3390618 RepID=UPI003D04C9F8